MILAVCISVLASYIYLKKKGIAGDTVWKDKRYYIENILLMMLLAELISRVVLHHNSMVVVLIYTVPAFGKKFVIILCLIALLTPALRFLCEKVGELIRRAYNRLEKVNESKPPISEKKVSSTFEKMIDLVCGIVIFAAIILGSGSLWSGYHLVDDHTFIGISHRLQAESLMDVIRSQIIYDLSIRFRPLYNVEIVLKSRLFGADMFWWMLLSMVEGILVFYLFCRIARNMKATRLEAFMFSGLLVFGEQFAPWYRAANQENTGMLLAAVVLFLITALYDQNGKKVIHRKWYYTGIIAVGILSSLQKEAFVLMLPAYFMLMLVLEKEQNPGEGIVKNVCNKIIILVLYTIVFVLEIYVIIFVVGTNKIGYAGFSSQSPLMSYISGIETSLMVNMRWITLTGVIAVFLLVMYMIIGHRSGKVVPYTGYILLALYILGTQLILYAKSGMSGRYMLPYMIGWAVLFVIVMFRILRNNWVLYWSYMTLCTALLILGLVSGFLGAREWTVKGEHAGSLLSTLNKTLTDYNAPKILVDFGGDVELEDSVQEWQSQYGQYDWNNHTTESETIDSSGIADADFDILVTTTAMYENGQGDCSILSQCIDKKQYSVTKVNDEYLIATRNR
jgi:hypothetical protein